MPNIGCWANGYSHSNNDITLTKENKCQILVAGLTDSHSNNMQKGHCYLLSK